MCMFDWRALYTYIFTLHSSHYLQRSNSCVRYYIIMAVYGKSGKTVIAVFTGTKTKERTRKKRVTSIPGTHPFSSVCAFLCAGFGFGTPAVLRLLWAQVSAVTDTRNLCRHDFDVEL